MRRPAWRTCRSYFNPRSPHGERRHFRNRQGQVRSISIHAPRTGSDTVRVGHFFRRNAISIHAPRTGSDYVCRKPERLCPHFNPRSPHGERHGGGVLLVSLEIFQSTLPARGATNCTAPGPPRRGHFNPRSPHGERRLTPRTRPSRNAGFQSTLPARGATWFQIKQRASPRNFNPRSPHGERLSARAQRTPTGAISIHAPRTGSDNNAVTGNIIREHFNPRSPHGERHAGCPPTMTTPSDFNPRSPHGERQEASAKG